MFINQIQPALLNAEQLIENNILTHYVELILPYIIAVLEIMGIIIVSWSAIKSFVMFVQNSFFKTNHNIQYIFAIGLATGLEFKMASEILNTVIVRNLEELKVLGAVILLRAILSILIHFEMKHIEK